MSIKLSPLVSVVMPVYNNRPFVAEAIESIINQSYSNLEIIIINDGSTDGSADVINDYAKKDDRINVLNQTNTGQAIASNNGIAVSQGLYIAKMDGDDICDLERIEKQIVYMQKNPNCDALTTFVSFYSLDLKKRLPDWSADRRCTSPSQIRNTLPFENCVTNAAMLFKAEVIKTLLYNHVEAAEDYDLWLRMISKGYKIHKIP